MDSAAFAHMVYEIVGRIPAGQVTTYGRIALALGVSRNARIVGWVLRRIVLDLGLPCHRVVNNVGYLSGGWAFGHPDRMQAMLMEEGVPFTSEYVVDLKACVWNPAEELDADVLEVIRGNLTPSAAAYEVNDLDGIT